MTRLASVLATLFLLGFAGSAFAQDTAPPPPHLSVVDGRASIERESGSEAAEPNTPLVVGDRIRTELGRAEVLLGDGSALHLDERTAIDINGDNVVRLLEGRLVVFAEGGERGALQIDSAPGSVRINGSGEVRLSLLNDGRRDGLEVAVVRGLVNVVTDGGDTPVRAGQQVILYEGDWPSAPMAFNSARADAFFEWSQGLLDSRRGTTSASYLPPDLTTYASSFDEYGTWGYQAPYGNVWYPTVAATWRPYHYGHWRYFSQFGWSFIGRDRWAYPTHHYGRWGLSPAGAWFWIPSRGWSAAWVNWAVAPGYVGWCPLGWNNQPVLGFWGRGGRYGRYNPGRAWTVMAAGTFSHRAFVPRANLDGHVFRGGAGPNFTVQSTPPTIAVPRGLVVAPSARIAGPSVLPHGDRSRGYPYSPSTDRRRGPDAPSVATSQGFRSGITRPSGAPVQGFRSGITRRPGVASQGFGSAVSRPPSAVRPPAASAPPVYTGRGYSVRSSPLTRTPANAAPPVIYYRGTPLSPNSSGGPASAYERAGVAVPRGLPGSVGSGSRSVMPTPSQRYGYPSAPPSGYGYPGSRQGPRMSDPTAGPRTGAPYAAPRMGTPPPASRMSAPMRSAPPAAAPPPPPARSAPTSSSQGTAVPRSGHQPR